MQPREWTPPATEPRKPAATPADAPAQSPRAHWGFAEYFVSFVYSMLFFGLIAGVMRSRFPIGLGLFLFFTKDELIAWTLRKAGIRLVPDSLGETFVMAFVWATGVSILFTSWRDSVPAWLSSWSLADAPWSVIAGAALGCAMLKAASTAFVRTALPWIGIEIARDGLAWTIIEGLVGFATLGLVFLLLSMPVFSNSPGH